MMQCTVIARLTKIQPKVLSVEAHGILEGPRPTSLPDSSSLCLFLATRLLPYHHRAIRDLDFRRHPCLLPPPSQFALASGSTHHPPPTLSSLCRLLPHGCDTDFFLATTEQCVTSTSSSRPMSSLLTPASVPVRPSPPAPSTTLLSPMVERGTPVASSLRSTTNHRCPLPHSRNLLYADDEKSPIPNLIEGRHYHPINPPRPRPPPQSWMDTDTYLSDDSQ
jgi:hypothetical protein